MVDLTSYTDSGLSSQYQEAGEHFQELQYWHQQATLPEHRESPPSQQQVSSAFLRQMCLPLSPLPLAPERESFQLLQLHG